MADVTLERARHRLSLSLPQRKLDLASLHNSDQMNIGLVNSFDKESLLKLCISIIKKPARYQKVINVSHRTQNQVKILGQMAHKLQFFRDIKRNYGNIVYQGCLNCIHHQQIQKGEVVFRSGDRGGRFYIILQGIKRTVGIYILLPSVLDKSVFEQKKVNDLGPGESFGELALLYDDSKRSATVIAQSDCELAFMDKIAYKRVIGGYQKDMINQKIDFLSKQPWLQRWSKREINTLSYHFIPQKYQTGDVVFREGDKSDNMFIVREGQVFEMSKIFLKQEVSSLKFQKLPSSLCRTRVMPASRTMFAFIKQSSCLLDPGQIFGEECFLHDSKHYKLNFRSGNKANTSLARMVTVKCKSLHGELYRITKEDVEQRFWDQQTSTTFIDTMQLVLDFRINRITLVGNKIKDENEQQSMHQINKQYTGFLCEGSASQARQCRYRLINKLQVRYTITTSRSATLEDTIFIQEKGSYSTAQDIINQRCQRNLKKIQRLEQQSSTQLIRIPDESSPTAYKKEVVVKYTRKPRHPPLTSVVSKSCLQKIISSIQQFKQVNSLQTNTSVSSQKDEGRQLMTSYEYILLSTKPTKAATLADHGSSQELHFQSNKQRRQQASRRHLQYKFMNFSRKFSEHSEDGRVQNIKNHSMVVQNEDKNTSDEAQIKAITENEDTNKLQPKPQFLSRGTRPTNSRQMRINVYADQLSPVDINASLQMERVAKQL